MNYYFLWPKEGEKKKFFFPFVPRELVSASCQVRNEKVASVAWSTTVHQSAVGYIKLLTNKLEILKKTKKKKDAHSFLLVVRPFHSRYICMQTICASASLTEPPPLSPSPHRRWQVQPTLFRLTPTKPASTRTRTWAPCMSLPPREKPDLSPRLHGLVARAPFFSRLIFHTPLSLSASLSLLARGFIPPWSQFAAWCVPPSHAASPSFLPRSKRMLRC